MDQVPWGIFVIPAVVLVIGVLVVIVEGLVFCGLAGLTRSYAFGSAAVSNLAAVVAFGPGFAIGSALERAFRESSLYLYALGMAIPVLMVKQLAVWLMNRRGADHGRVLVIAGITHVLTFVGGAAGVIGGLIGSGKALEALTELW